MSVASLSVGLPPHSAGHSGSSGGGSVNGASLDAERLTQESFARRCEWIRYLKNAHEGSVRPCPVELIRLLGASWTC